MLSQEKMFLMRLWRHKDPEVGKPWSAHSVPWKGERKLWEGVCGQVVLWSLNSGGVQRGTDRRAA